MPLSQYNGYIQPPHIPQQWHSHPMHNPTPTQLGTHPPESSPNDPKRRRFEEIATPTVDRRVDNASATAPNTIRIVDTPDQPSTSTQNTNQVTAPWRPMQRSLLEIRSGNYVYHCLKMQGIVGKQIFAAYDKWVREDDDTNFAYFRPKIARFVMSQAMDNCHDMKRDRFLYIRASWGECFPKDAEGDNLSIVYEPSSTGIDAKGFLYVAYLHHNGNSYENDLLEKPKRNSNIADNGTIGVAQRVELQVLRELRLVNQENIQTWVLRLSVRLDYYQKSTLEEMLNDLIVLKVDKAEDLTTADFEIIHNGKGNALVDAWPTLSSALIELARFKAKTAKDKEDILNCLAEWEAEPEVAAWFVLSLLFNAASLPNRKLTKNEATTYFIQVIQVGERENVADRLRASQQRLAIAIAKSNDKLIPRVVFCRLATSRRFFVVLSESTHYEVDSLTEAVNLCYKCLAVFPMFRGFNKTVRHIWGFIEIFIFGIKIAEHKKTVIQNFIVELNRSMKRTEREAQE
ncbi:hypothetical protein QAD02_006324 [Eretmocerus hayati]|uniref:Uncharacterized protein n=1 Tax=Eretmocerus hayati TaxID=131215 RepID=A0ACC2N2U9_9HYME|nr:hypothetical protein QAD02_006324 [Eretmocerus hayati]